MENTGYKLVMTIIFQIIHVYVQIITSAILEKLHSIDGQVV
jgi:hypothetical protein